MSTPCSAPCRPCFRHLLAPTDVGRFDSKRASPDLPNLKPQQAGADFERVDLNRIRLGSDSRQRLGSSGGPAPATPHPGRPGLSTFSRATASSPSMSAPRDSAPKRSRSVKVGQKLSPTVASRTPPPPPPAADDDDDDDEIFTTVRTRGGGGGWTDSALSGFGDTEDDYTSAFDVSVVATSTAHSTAHSTAQRTAHSTAHSTAIRTPHTHHPCMHTAPGKGAAAGDRPVRCRGPPPIYHVFGPRLLSMLGCCCCCCCLLCNVVCEKLAMVLTRTVAASRLPHDCRRHSRLHLLKRHTWYLTVFHVSCGSPTWCVAVRCMIFGWQRVSF